MLDKKTKTAGKKNNECKTRLTGTRTSVSETGTGGWKGKKAKHKRSADVKTWAFFRRVWGRFLQYNLPRRR